ncbi:MAG: hypothetical protein WEB06_12775 [Actinomycetota bacterium]
MIKISAAGIALALAALSPSATATAQTYPPVPQPLVIDKSVVRPGELVTVQGGGATPNATVTITFDGADPVDVASITAASDGTFRASFNIPLVATPGRHDISATSEGRSLGTVTVTVVVRQARRPFTGGGQSLLPYLIIGALVLTGVAGAFVVRRRGPRAG